MVLRAKQDICVRAQQDSGSKGLREVVQDLGFLALGGWMEEGGERALERRLQT